MFTVERSPSSISIKKEFEEGQGKTCGSGVATGGIRMQSSEYTTSIGPVLSLCLCSCVAGAFCGFLGLIRGMVLWSNGDKEKSREAQLKMGSLHSA
jgi:hypothetical protein